MQGKRLGPYAVDRVLGMGSTGRVYAATLQGRAPGLVTGAQVALKIVHPYLVRNQRRLELLRSAAQIGIGLRHENVVATFDCDQLTVGGEPVTFVVMEHVDGSSLFGLLQEQRRTPEELCRRLAQGICGALDAIHAAGVAHGNLRPSKVLITPDGVVKVLGMGAPRDTWAPESQPMEAAALMGTPLYLAPEQLRGPESDARTDLHALGLMLYELAAGCHPYGQTGRHVAMSLLFDGPPPRLRSVAPFLSATFDDIVHTLLAKEPDARFQSAADVLVALTES